MINLLRKKPILKELIPPGSRDIHNHILPGIDDGAKSLSDTKVLLQGLKNLGFDSVVATPHTMAGVWENTPETIKESHHAVTNIASELELPLGYASEYMLDRCFTDHLEAGLLKVSGKKVLVEMSFIQPPQDLYELLWSMQLKGYTPILAHPERYSYFFNDFDSYERLKNAGCDFQLNLMSTVGHYGTEEAKVADKLLKAGMIDFVATDIHHERHLAVYNNRVKISALDQLEKAFEKTKALS